MKDAAKSPAAPLALHTADAVMRALRTTKYGTSAWALFENVSNATGYRANRWADALAMSIWPSRGLHIHGFEIKVSRGDFLRELANPKKADDMAKQCDFWWVVAGSESIVKLEELPPPWGLLVPCNGRGSVTLRAAKEATQFKTKATLERTFVAAILRRAAECFDREALRQQVRQDVYQEVQSTVVKSVADSHECETRMLREQIAQLHQTTADLRTQLGAAVEGGYDARIIGRAATLLSHLNAWDGGERAVEQLIGTLERNITTLTTVRENMNSALDVIRTLAPKQGQVG